MAGDPAAHDPARRGLVDREERARLLGELVALPTVSADPARLPDLHRSAALLAGALRERGFDVRLVEDGAGRPSVAATRGLRQGVPSALLYAHHDVQPAGAGWTTDPFVPVRRGDVLVGRGSADNKAGVVAHLAAIDALDADADSGSGSGRGLGLIVLLDGGEEVGSPGAPALLAGLALPEPPALVLVNDGVNATRGTPSLTTSLRGLLAVDVEVAVMTEPAHSGINGGGVLDALTAFCRLAASLHDEHGEVAVPGLRIAGPATARVDPAAFRARLGLLDGVHVADDLATALWASPALSVLGVDAPAVADSANVLLPWVRARLSLRVPPGLATADAAAALRAHLLAHRPFGAQVRVDEVSRSEPWSDARISAVVVDALREAWGRAPDLLGGGGGIPVVSALAAAFPESVVCITAIADADSRVHGPDENVDLRELDRAVAAETAILTALALPRD
ncbi:M20/M25/M40 family metallo-hydrolase [Rathayibacter sp. VKM Ac-2857]|uniref:M20/M25/M40 family metallo-hydrolase n=1 Tax=Rathayibacter sp. VKM Ac-2857 TaxID=2739020 RepID=UPI0015665201|nr:M20/M25/M40 family metallo-hydrolase [Rathayibacter sp. VKM Ac-2857]NQX17376.1 M20/M25/M40 family metallo-hydrolase [Rathayibacter sp. VKM Ac-2857]